MAQDQQNSNIPDLPKTCATCEHLRGRRAEWQDWEKWQCFLTPKTFNVVSGAFDYVLCTESRKAIQYCRYEARWYKLYVHPTYVPAPATSKPSLADQL